MLSILRMTMSRRRLSYMDSSMVPLTKNSFCSRSCRVAALSRAAETAAFRASFAGSW